MNAAYLMLTTAWLAGADPVPVAPAPAPAPAAIGGSCNGGCGGCASSSCGCEDPCGKKPGLFARLCAKKGNDCGCEQSCQTCKPAREPKCKAPREPKCRAPKNDCCAPAPTCNSCDSCDQKHGLIARWRAKKSHGDCGCESSCGSGCGNGCGSGCGGAIAAPPAGTAPPAEAVPVPPKTNPAGKTAAAPMLLNVTPVVAPF